MRYKFLIYIALLCGASQLVAQESTLPKKAKCAVCALKGETEPEKVKAFSEYDNKMYYFCAVHCKEQFDADPLAYLPPQLPRPAPDFAVETLEGSTISLQNYRGKLVLIDFWATWCKPCLKMMPAIQQLYNSYADHGLAVLGISLDEGDDKINKIRKFITKANITYPVFSDAKQQPAWATYKVKAIPAMFLIDQTGQIVGQWTGEAHFEAVRAEIIRLLETPASPDEPANLQNIE